MVKIVEFHDIDNEKSLPFNLVDDTVFFMRNDPMFYRKEYFPTISRIADMHRSGTKYNPSKILSPCIEKAIVEYCKRYNLARTPEEIFTNEDRNGILQMIYSEEMEQIKKGEYL